MGSCQRVAAAALLGAGLGLLSPAPAALAAPPAPGAPRPVIEVRETAQDGGIVEEGTLVKYRFTVANRGQVDLEIPQVNPSCGCTVPHWAKRIKPGQEATIEADVHTEHFRGPISKALTVFSNDPERPQLELTMTARVTPLVQTTPGPAVLLSLEDRPVTREFTLERTGGHPMRILEVSGSPAFLQTEVIPLPGEGRYTLKVTADTNAPLGHHNVLLSVQTDLEKLPTLMLVVTVERGIITIPSSVAYLLPAGPLTTPINSVVTISRRSGSFHVKEMTVDDPMLQAKLETIHEGSEYRVKLAYSGGWGSGRVQKLLTVMTDDPQQPVIRIPVQAVVQEKTTAAGPS